jgi:hypothetical protein
MIAWYESMLQMNHERYIMNTKENLLRLQRFGHKVSRMAQELLETPTSIKLEDFKRIHVKYEEEIKKFFNLAIEEAAVLLEKEKEINEINLNDISSISDDSILKIFSLSKEAISVPSRENKSRSEESAQYFKIINDTRDQSQMSQIRKFSSFIAKSSKPRKYNPNKIRISKSGNHSSPKQLMDQSVADYRRTFYNIGLASDVSEELISKLISLLNVSWYNMSKPGRKVYAFKKVSEATKIAVKDLLLSKKP